MVEDVDCATVAELAMRAAVVAAAVAEAEQRVIVSSIDDTLMD